MSAETFAEELKRQHATPHMRGPWVVEERWMHSLLNDRIRVVYRTERIEITIAEWDMSGIRRGSPAYFLVRADAELIAAAPTMREALNKCDDAFASWQVGEFPGRPEDILALINEVREALAKAKLPATAGGMNLCASRALPFETAVGRVVAMSVDAKCPQCGGSGIIRPPEGLIKPCECVTIVVEKGGSK